MYHASCSRVSRNLPSAWAWPKRAATRQKIPRGAIFISNRTKYISASLTCSIMSVSAATRDPMVVSMPAKTMLKKINGSKSICAAERNRLSVNNIKIKLFSTTWIVFSSSGASGVSALLTWDSSKPVFSARWRRSFSLKFSDCCFALAAAIADSGTVPTPGFSTFTTIRPTMTASTVVVR